MVVSHFPGRGTIVEEAYLEGEVAGRAVGKAEAVVAVLEARGFAVSEAVRDRLFACADLARLDTWLARAVTVERAEELFGEE
jgi:hypothetical protein